MHSFSSSSSAGQHAGDQENRDPPPVSSTMLFGVRINIDPMETPSGSLDSVQPNEPAPAVAAAAVAEAFQPEEGPDEGNWTIKKTLQRSDVDGSARLLLGRKHDMVGYVGEFDDEEGVELGVYDVDTGTAHTLVLKKWKTRSYILNKGWTRDFVRRRRLRKNDEIGLRWEEQHRRFEFTVIKRAPISTIMFF